MLSGDLLDRQRIHRDVVEPRIEALGSVKVWVGVFRHQAIEELYFRRPIILDANCAKTNNASIAHRRVALELAVGKDRTHFGRFETDARPRHDVVAEMSGNPRVSKNLPVRINEQVGYNIGSAIRTHCRKMHNAHLLQKAVNVVPSHDLVLPAYDTLAHGPASPIENQPCKARRFTGSFAMGL